MEVSRFRHLNISSRRSKCQGVTGPLAFLTLAVEEFQVPYFYTRRSLLVEAGAGASFQVRHIELNQDLYHHDERTDPGHPKKLRGISQLTKPTYQKGQWMISKHIAPASPAERESYALDRRAMDSARLFSISQEMRILSHEPLLQHKNIVDLVAFMWEKEVDEFGRRWPILVLRDASCGTLEDFFQLGPVSSDVSFGLAKDIARGLDALHNCGVVHGDLKLQNILVFESPTGGFFAQVSDFGLSTIVSDLDSDETDFIQLPGFSEPWEPPETYEDIPLEDLPKIDVYGFGLLFCGLMTQGRDVFENFKIGCSSDEFLYDFAAIRELKSKDTSMISFCQEFVQKGASYTSIELETVKSVLECSLYLEPGRRSFMCDLFKLLEPEQIKPEKNELETEAKRAESTNKIQISPLPEETTTFSESIPKNLHEWDKRLVFAVKDDLVSELEAKASPEAGSRICEENPEAAIAAYTLSCWYFSGDLGTFSYDKGLDWLLKAAQYGSIQAKSRVSRAHSALGKPFPNDLIEMLPNWLGDAVLQYEYPGEMTMMENFPKQMPLLLRKLRTIYCGYGQDCFGDEYREEYPLDSPKTFIQQVHESDLGINDRHKEVGMTWLHYAASMGNLEVVKLLVLEGSDPNVINVFYETPLFMACQGGHADVIAYLLPWTDITKHNKTTELKHNKATELEHLDKFRPEDIEDIASKLHSRASDINDTDSIGRTPLTTILNMNGPQCLEAIRLLLNLGSDPLIKDDEGVCAFSQAVVNLSVSQFNEILKHIRPELRVDAKVDALAALMDCPFHDSIVRVGTDYSAHISAILKLLVDDAVCQHYKIKYGHPLLNVSSAIASLELIRALIPLLPVAAVNEFQLSAKGWSTPLQAAVVENRPQVVDLLLQQGATPAIPHPTEWTILFYAAIWTPTVVSYLLKHVEKTMEKAEALEFVNRCDSDGATAFATAVAGGFFDCADVFVEYGVNYQSFTLPYSRTEDRLMSVLGWSCYMAPQVDYLLQLSQPADFVIDSLGTTILHCVCGVPMDRTTPTEANQLLCTVLARFSLPQYANCRDDEGCTPLHYAGRFANVVAIQKLIDTFGKELDLQAVNHDGQTVLDEAELRAYHDLSDLGRLARKDYAVRTKKVAEMLRGVGVSNGSKSS